VVADSNIDSRPVSGSQVAESLADFPPERIPHRSDFDGEATICQSINGTLFAELLHSGTLNGPGFSKDSSKSQVQVFLAQLKRERGPESETESFREPDHSHLRA
jgi:hypothetical protein